MDASHGAHGPLQKTNVSGQLCLTMYDRMSQSYRGNGNDKAARSTRTPLAALDEMDGEDETEDASRAALAKRTALTAPEEIEGENETEDAGSVVFSRRARPGGKTKRIERGRLSFSVASSEDDEDDGAPSVPLRAVNKDKVVNNDKVRKKGRRIAGARFVPGYEELGVGGKERVATGADYSAAGIERLRMEGLGVGARVVGLESAEDTAGDLGKVNMTAGEEGLELSGGELSTTVSKADGSSSVVGVKNPFSEAWRKDSEVGVGEAMDVSGLEYISLNGKNLDVARGTKAMPESKGDADAFAVHDGGSDADEWEMEQLRRAGHGGVRMREEESIQSARWARSVIDEEEEGVITSGGEVGESVLDTVLADVREAKILAESNLQKVEGDVTSVRKAVEKSFETRRELHDVIEGAKERYEFYAGLTRYVSDVSEMLTEKQVDIIAFRESRASRLKDSAKRVLDELESDVDEFGREREPLSMSLKTNVAGNGMSDSDSEENDALHSQNDRRPSDKTDDCELSAPDDPYVDVDDDFKSVEVIARRFQEWKARYPDDYKNAYGDLSLGKLAGAVLLGVFDVGDLVWLKSLPSGARASAVSKSRVVEERGLEICAHWRPRSVRSTKEHAKAVRKILDCFRGKGSDDAVKVSTVGVLVQAFCGRLEAEARALSDAAKRGALDSQAVGLATVTAMECAILVYDTAFHGVLKSDDAFLRLANLVAVALTDVVLISASHISDDDGAYCELLIRAVYAVGTSSRSNFPTPQHPGWASLRSALAQRTGSADSRIPVCLARIGGAEL